MWIKSGKLSVSKPNHASEWRGNQKQSCISTDD